LGIRGLKRGSHSNHVMKTHRVLAIVGLRPRIPTWPCIVPQAYH
jgi:hypothetical protein